MVVVFVPPREVRDLVDREQLVERAEHLAAQLRARGVDRLVALGTRRGRRLLEVVRLVHLEEVADLAER